jgi:branched-chain amino acid aminotransferase
MQTTEWIWRDGEFIPWAQATTHVMTHALHYGSAVFEGIRAYATRTGPQFFRLRDHLRRLRESAAIYQMPLQWDLDGLAAACKLVVRENGLPAAYVRPLLFRGYSQMGLDPTGCPVVAVISAWVWDNYLGRGDEGVDVCVSSWRRVAPATLPAMAKAAGNYLSSQLIRLEAKAAGFAEGLALTPDGHVGEASGENVFVIRDRMLYTPDAASSILLGVTRDSVIQLARALGHQVHETRVPRELLYVADEVFLCGTAAEITPVRSVDRRPVGDGKPGPLTRALRKAFFGLFDGKTPVPAGWLEPC